MYVRVLFLYVLPPVVIWKEKHREVHTHITKHLRRNISTRVLWSMSEEQIELHKFVVGSPSSPGKMSSTDALLNSTRTDGHTEVGPMGPLYQTVPEAQRSHTQYATEPVQVVTRGDNVYTVPSESDPPNEYDFINERQPRGGQVKHVAENVLYADQATADKFRHAATMEKAGSFKFTGSVSEGVKEPTGDGITCCRCKMKDVFYCFFHLIGIVLGVAALALAVVIILGAIPIGSSCNCNTSEWNHMQQRDWVVAWKPIVLLGVFCGENGIQIE